VIAVLDNPPLTEALKQWRARETMTLDLSSAEIRGFSRELRMRSVFSARTTNAEYLDEIAKTLDGLISGKFGMAEARYRLFKKLKQLGYDPEVGFPQDMANIPPAERGTLQDLSSDARITLVLETNMRIAANYGRMVEGNTPFALYSYPAWELVRLYQRNVPRGTPESHTAGWLARWQDAGESVAWDGAVESPMVARKDSAIWQALGDGAGGYEDTLSNPFPPFAFNSGMAWKAVDRARCLALGLITADETPGKMVGKLAPGEQEMKSIADGLSPDLRAALLQEMEEDKEGERLRLAHAEHLKRQDAIRRDRIARRDERLEAGKKMVEALMA
jgi:hypothetical protein